MVKMQDLCPSGHASKPRPTNLRCGCVDTSTKVGERSAKYLRAKIPDRDKVPLIPRTVNAATANEGKARVLVHGPVVIDLLDAANDEAVPQDWTSTRVCIERATPTHET
jgi:hypothetical protein